MQSDRQAEDDSAFSSAPCHQGSRFLISLSRKSLMTVRSRSENLAVVLFANICRIVSTVTGVSDAKANSSLGIEFRS